MDRIIVGMTGATGQIYGVSALELLQETTYESHLVYSNAALLTLKNETEYDEEHINDLADTVHSVKNIGAPPASGSFQTDGMIVTPCSMKTLSAIANGYADNLITRAADVTLKEQRPLVLLPREKPLNRIHLQNMLTVVNAGGTIVPPVPSFYHNPNSIEEMVRRTVARALSLLNVDISIAEYGGLDSNREE